MSRQLPRGWDERFDEKSGRTYYVNHHTRQTSWTLPSEDPLPPGWEQQYDEKGRVFFINHEREITTWTDPRNATQTSTQVQQQQQTFSRDGKVLQPGTLIKVHKSQVEAIAAMVINYDEHQGTHVIALENGKKDSINLAAVSHEDIDDLMERTARLFVICEQAHRAFPPQSDVIELSLRSLAETFQSWVALYKTPGALGNNQAELAKILGYLMDPRTSLVLIQAMELGGTLGESAVVCMAGIIQVLRLADPTSVTNVSRSLQEAGIARSLVYLLRGASPDICVQILHVISFFTGDESMVQSFRAADGVVLVCELLVNAAIQKHAVAVLQQMIEVDTAKIVQVIRDCGGVQ